MKRVLVTGAGGFIGWHLCKYLKSLGYWVRGVDKQRPEFEPTAADEFLEADLRFKINCSNALCGIDHVYHLAADMGGIGYITHYRANIMVHDAIMNAHMLHEAMLCGVERFLFTSSACVYPRWRQTAPRIVPIREEEAWKSASPEPGYGHAKLYMEKMCEFAREEWGLDTCVARQDPIYGPLGAYDNGREKAPAALCRKIALAKDGDTVEIWGDGQQTRSFLYVDDGVVALHRLMQSNEPGPINIGSEEIVSIGEMVQMIAEIAGKTITPKYLLDAPQGVRGRYLDITRAKQKLGWEPRVCLREGLTITYRWIESELRKRGLVA